MQKKKCSCANPSHRTYLVATVLLSCCYRVAMVLLPCCYGHPILHPILPVTTAGELANAASPEIWMPDIKYEHNARAAAVVPGLVDIES